MDNSSFTSVGLAVRQFVSEESEAVVGAFEAHRNPPKISIGDPRRLLNNGFYGREGCTQDPHASNRRAGVA